MDFTGQCLSLTATLSDMNPYLVITVGDHETKIDYAIGEQSVVSHSHPVGLKTIELEGMNTIAASKFMDGVIYALEFVSLYDRIPTRFTLKTPRYASWLSEILEAGSYTQFYTNQTPVRVTIEGTPDPSLGYARHTQTILSFKV